MIEANIETLFSWSNGRFLAPWTRISISSFRKFQTFSINDKSCGKKFKTILVRNQSMLFWAFSSCNFLDFSLSTFLTFFQSFLFCHFRFLALELLNSGLISMEIETSIHYVYNSVCTISIWFTFKRLQCQDFSVKNYESLESL